MPARRESLLDASEMSFELPVVELSLAGVQQLTNVADMERILKETLQQKSMVERNLQDHITNKRNILETKLEKLEVLPTKLRPVFSQIQDLTKTVNDTCTLAENVSSKVKALDRTKDRLQQTQKRVEDILEVQNCVSGIDIAMESENWETSCHLFKTYLEIVQQEKEASKGSKKRIRVLEESSAALLQTKLETLQSIIRKKARQAQSEEEVVRYCQLFTPLGLSEEGLNLYIQYIRSNLKEEADKIYTQLRRSLDGKLDDDTKISCTDAVTSLFESVANYAQTQIPIIKKSFGEEFVLVLLKELQQQCDVHAPKMLDRFQEQFAISDSIRKIKNFRERRVEEKPSAYEMEEILDGMAALSQRAALYNRFMHGKVNIINESQSNSGKQLVKLLHESMLDRSMHDMLDQYVIMEHYFMEENVAKAISLNSSNRANSVLQSPLVDHVFFLLKRCLNRSLYTFNPHAVSVVSNYISQCLSQQLKDELIILLRNQSGSQPIENVIANFMTALNSLFQCTENIKLLKNEADREVARIFVVESKRQQVLMRLEDLTDTSYEFKQLLDKHLAQLVSTVQPTIRTELDKFRSVSYELNEYQFAENEINDPFAMSFLEGLDHMFDDHKPHLVLENFESFLHLCLKMIAPHMEKSIFQKQFTQFGALQLDKDLRTIMSYFSTVSQRSIRGEFSRLIQITSLLNLEDVSEVLDYWGENSGQMTWRLAPSEVHKVLSRRMDFSGAEIAALKL